MNALKGHREDALEVLWQADELNGEAPGATLARCAGNTAQALQHALADIWGAGLADEGGGDVEAPCGYFIRVAQYTLHTDEQGHMYLTEWYDALAAATHIMDLRDEYKAWLAGEGDV